jgi:hypothetical protein
MRLAKLILSTAITSVITFSASKLLAQESSETPTDTIAKSLNELKSDVGLLKKIKLSGYMQPQFQIVDSAGAASFAGGNFAPFVDKRFMLRRSRIKIAYETTSSQFIFQIDVSEKGLTIKDMYAKFTEPWLNAISLTSGMMNRPFGYEIGYSSSLRESPERGRMSQIIFPNERDLGAMLTFQMPKTSKFNFFKAEGGMYNGTGAPSAGANTSDFDFQKDFIGHIVINKSNKSEKFKVSGGVSYYSGGWRQGTKKVYNEGVLANGAKGFIVDSTSTNKGKIAMRKYMGADLQVSFDFPFGLTTIRGEYIQGQQPGVASSSASPAAQPAVDTYIRNFNGAYLYFLQNILQTKNQLIVKYDWYDPNTKVAGNEIGATGSNLSATDIKYTTLGLGWAYRWDANVKLTFYYDMVTNETTKLAGYSKDLKDNVFTCRVQYKF